MHVDQTTLADLEVFSARDGSAGLFQIVDHTTTIHGRASLKRRFLQPSSDHASIARTQEAVRFLVGHPMAQFDAKLVEAVVGYVRSNIVAAQRSIVGYRAEEAWMSLRYPALLDEIRMGVRSTKSLVEIVDRTCALINSASPPELLEDLTMRLAAISNAVRPVWRATSSLAADSLIRGGLRSDIESALYLLGELDALNSMALATRENGWTFPDLIDSQSFALEAEGVFHPFVLSPVTNPVRLTGGEPMVFLTGPNMAGKTTYLRSVALIVLLSQVGMGVPAARARLTPVDHLFTSLNPADNLRAGLSYFFAEVLRVKEAATILAAGERALVLFDEVFKGTNVLDALEASAEVILGFARARQSGFIFSSHLTQLVDVLRANPSIRFCCFDGEIVSGTPSYNYALRDGVSDKRFGLLLLRQARVPELIAQIH